MRPRSIALFACLALAWVVASLVPVACAGAAGSIGLGIATLGISAILPGSSPGWRATDPRFAAPVRSAPAALLSGALSRTGLPVTVTAATTPSDPLLLSPGEQLDRLVFAGGEVQDRVSISARASATGGGSTLRATLIHSAWANAKGDSTILARGSATVPPGAASDVSIVLDFTSFQEGTATFGELAGDPGDVFTIRFENAGGDDISIDPSATRIDYSSEQTRSSELSFASDRGGSFQVDGRQARSLTANTGTAAFIEALDPQVVVGVSQVAVLRGLVKDIDANPIPGLLLDFQAAGSSSPSGQARTDADGIASVQLSWSAPGPFHVTLTSSGAAGGVSADFNVDVLSTPVRTVDGLVSFAVRQGQPSSASVAIDVTAALDVSGSRFASNAGETTFPDDLVFEFAEDSASHSEWAFDLAVRTLSFAPTASAQLIVRILDAQGSIVAQSPAVDATSALERKTGTMTQVQPLLIVAQGGAAGGSTVAPFLVSIEVIASSDPANPGIEVVTDASVGSAVFVPGPVVYGVRGSTAFLSSSPDPRQ